MTQADLFELPAPPTDENHEWYTPAEYIEAARRVMGSIDLDPASCVEAQRIVQAHRYYTVEEDGLTKIWSGNIWLNPPYGRGLIERFVEKLMGEDVEQAVVLVNNCTETSWFQELLTWCEAVCFPKGRIAFWGPLSEGNTARQGQAIFYFGDNEALFSREFQAFGRVM